MAETDVIGPALRDYLNTQSVQADGSLRGVVNSEQQDMEQQVQSMLERDPIAKMGYGMYPKESIKVGPNVAGSDNYGRFDKLTNEVQINDNKQAYPSYDPVGTLQHEVRHRAFETIRDSNYPNFLKDPNLPTAVWSKENDATGQKLNEALYQMIYPRGPEYFSKDGEFDSPQVSRTIMDERLGGEEFVNRVGDLLMGTDKKAAAAREAIASKLHNLSPKEKDNRTTEAIVLIQKLADKLRQE